MSIMPPKKPVRPDFSRETHTITPTTVLPPQQLDQPRSKLQIAPKGIMFVGVAALVLAQLLLPADQTPAAFVGRTMTIAYTQANERVSVIETMKEQLSVYRQAYATTHSEAEAFKAKCGFLVLLGPLADDLMRQLPGGGNGLNAQQMCNMLFEINYGPQLRELQTEIARIQDEIRDLEGAL